MSDTKLSFNCTSIRHRTAKCRCPTTCKRGNGNHHSLICDKLSNQLMLATDGGQAVYPVVVVQVHGIRCRALLDTRAGGSCASAELISKLNRQPDRRKYIRMEMMMKWTIQNIEIHKVQDANIKGVFSLPTNLSKVDKGTLLSQTRDMWI